MNNLLVFFALPIATIILAAVLQKLIKSPILVALIFFAVYLIVTFAVFDSTFLVATIVYTILAFITASIVKFICCFLRNICCRNNRCCNEEIINNSNFNVELLTSNTLANESECTCRNNTQNVFNNGYNRGYNNGYDNGYNNAFELNNNDTNNSSCCRNRRNR